MFLVLQGTTKQVHLLLKKINQIHTSIQFTLQHTQNKKTKKKKTDVIAPQKIYFHTWTHCVA